MGLCDTLPMTSKSKLTLAAVLLCSLLLSGCQKHPPWNGSLEVLMRSQPHRFATVMSDPAKHRVQIIYTRIDRDDQNRPHFRSYTYRLNADEYFYPASTVKLPVALLALEKINRLNVPGLDRNTTMLTSAEGHGQTSVTADPTAPEGLPSVAHYIRKVLLVSDNDAFNRLYEFVGQAAINESLHAKGLKDTRILHRLDLVLDVETNRYTNPVSFVDGATVLFSQDGAYSPRSLVASRPEMLGRAEVVDGVLVRRSKDFAEKNAFPLQDLHDVLKALLFPECVTQQQRFDLTPDDYRFIYKTMSRYPDESGIDEYQDSDEDPQAFVKYLMYDRDETILETSGYSTKSVRPTAFLPMRLTSSTMRRALSSSLPPLCIRMPMKPSMTVTTSTKPSVSAFCEISDGQSMRSSPAVKKQILRTSAGLCSTATSGRRERGPSLPCLPSGGSGCFSAYGHACEHDHPQQRKDQPAQGKQPEARHDTIARQMHVAVGVSENDVGPRQNQRQYSCLPGQECDDDDNVEKYRGLEEVGQMSGMNPKMVGFVGVPVQPEEFWIDLAFPDRRKPQPRKTKKAEGGQSKHREDGIENVHGKELLCRTADSFRDTSVRVGAHARSLAIAEG